LNKKLLGKALLPLLVLALALGLSACGSSDDDASAGETSGSSGGAAPGESLRFIYVNSNPSSEPTGAIINSGMEAAGEELGVDVEYRSTQSLEFTPTELKRLLENAVAAKPDGLIVSDTEPDALNAEIKAASDSGIPVVLSSTGFGQTEATGALTYVGNDELATGELGGEMLKEAGATHALMVSIPPGVPIVEEREEGFEKGFGGEVTTLAVDDFADTTAATNAIVAALQKDSDIDGVFGIGSALSPAELAAMKQIGADAGEIKWSTIDIGPEVLKAVEDGSFAFALDQQPYLQGYLPVLYLKQ